jgi:hypothetical protein
MYRPINHPLAQGQVDFFAKQIFPTHIIKRAIRNAVPCGGYIRFLKGIAQCPTSALDQSGLRLRQIAAAASESNQRHE